MGEVIHLFRAGEDSEGLIEVLSPAVYQPTREKVAGIINEFAFGTDKGIFVSRSDRQIIGALAYTNIGHDSEIEYISVKETHRKRGVGKALVEALISEVHPNRVFLETDKDGVGFYESIGFTVKSLGEKYEGVERFLCEKCVAFP